MSLILKRTIIIIVALAFIAGCKGKDRNREAEGKGLPDSTGANSKQDPIDRYKEIKDPAERQKFIAGLTEQERQKLYEDMKKYPMIFELSPPVAQAGDKQEIIGMNFGEDKEKTRVAFIGEKGTAYGEIKELSDYEIMLLVPLDVPGGALSVDVQKQDESGKWLSSMNQAVFWTPAGENQVATKDIGPTETKATGEAIGYIRDSGGDERYFLKMEEGLLTVSAESLKIEGHTISNREGGFPDLYLKLRDDSGSGILANDDRSRENLNPLLDKVPLEAGKYYLEVEGDPDDKHDQGEQGKGWFRLATRVDRAPFIRSIEPALGPGNTVIVIGAENLVPDSSGNKVELVSERPFLHFWSREVAEKAEVEELKIVERGSWYAPYYKLRIRTPANLKPVEGGYRIRIGNERGNSDVYPESSKYRYFYCESGDEDSRALYGRPVEADPKDEITYIGHTAGESPALVFDAFQSQALEIWLLAIEPDLTPKPGKMILKLYPPDSDEPVVATSEEIEDDWQKLFFEFLPESGEYQIAVEPEQGGAAGLFLLSLSDKTEEPPEHRIEIVSGNRQLVKAGPYPEKPLVVRVTRQGKPWAGASVVFEAPCKSAVITTDEDGEASWSDYPKPPKKMSATVSARVRGSGNTATFMYSTMDYYGRSYGDWDHDRLSVAEEMALGTDPYVADSDGNGVQDGIQYRDELRSNPEIREKAKQIEKAYEDYYKTCPKENFTSWSEGYEVPSAGSSMRVAPRR